MGIIGQLLGFIWSVIQFVWSLFNHASDFYGTIMEEFTDSYKALGSIFPFLPVWFVPCAATILTMTLWYSVYKALWR